MNKRMIKKVDDFMRKAITMVAIDEVTNETKERLLERPVKGSFMRKHFNRWVVSHNVPTHSYGSKFNKARAYYLELVIECNYQYTDETVYVRRWEG